MVVSSSLTGGRLLSLPELKPQIRAHNGREIILLERHPFNGVLNFSLVVAAFIEIIAAVALFAVVDAAALAFPFQAFFVVPAIGLPLETLLRLGRL